MAEVIALGGFRTEVLNLLLQPIEQVYNKIGYYGYSRNFPNNIAYRQMVALVLRERYSMLSEEDFVSLCDVFFNFIDSYLIEHKSKNRFLPIDDFVKLDIFRKIISNGVNSTLSLLEREILKSYGVN